MTGAGEAAGRSGDLRRVHAHATTNPSAHSLAIGGHGALSWQSSVHVGATGRGFVGCSHVSAATHARIAAQAWTS
jgi:hypothetical protein